jgi:hypothetical protein
MEPSNLSLVPLQQASLCLDCETITAAQTKCHACGSRALLNLARALDEPGYLHSFRPDTAVIHAALAKHAPRLGDFLHST